MKIGYAVMDTHNINDIEQSGEILMDHLQAFTGKLTAFTDVEMPKGIIFHDLASATELFSSIPLPAYTSKDLVHIDPRVSTWKTIYLSTAEDIDSSLAKRYYENLKVIDVATIAAHEIVHHSEFFHSEFDDYDEDSMWFEEGMCQYLPYKWMMPADDFEACMFVEDELILGNHERFGKYSLTEFGEAGGHYAKDASYSALLYDYWRSAKAIHFLVEEYFSGDVSKLIKHYQKWVELRESTLALYFVESLKIEQVKAAELGLL